MLNTLLPLSLSPHEGISSRFQIIKDGTVDDGPISGGWGELVLVKIKRLNDGVKLDIALMTPIIEASVLFLT